MSRYLERTEDKVFIKNGSKVVYDGPWLKELPARMQKYADKNKRRVEVFNKYHAFLYCVNPSEVTDGCEKSSEI